MNVVVISGRLTHKPELKEVSSSMNVCQFSLAVDRDKIDSKGNREVDFIECVCFNKQAENLTKYLDKGSFIEVKGRIQVDRYINKEGKNVSRTLIYSDTIKFIGKPQTSGSEAKSDEKDPYQEMGNRVSEESELPF